MLELSCGARHRAGFVRYVFWPTLYTNYNLINANWYNREEGASLLKIVDDFIAGREEQLLDKRIVTFNLKDLPVNRKLPDTPVKL